jgi:hypothetical protein
MTVLNLEHLIRRSENKQLVTVLSQKDNAIGGFVGSQHVYDLRNVSASSTIEYEGSQGVGGIEVSLNPDELEKGLSKQALQKKFDETKTGPAALVQSEYFSDMVAEHSGKQAKKKQKKDEKKFKF